MCVHHCLCIYIFFFKQKTAYEMRISDWSSDVCSSDLGLEAKASLFLQNSGGTPANGAIYNAIGFSGINTTRRRAMIAAYQDGADGDPTGLAFYTYASTVTGSDRTEEHTSELKSLMRLSYAVLRLK